MIRKGGVGGRGTKRLIERTVSYRFGGVFIAGADVSHA